MSRALNLLLTGCLLQGALCGEFKALMPETIKVLSGSCVTIPCSFDVGDGHDKNLDSTCRAIWKNQNNVIFDSSNSQTDWIKGHLTGNLRNKDCSTTLNDMLTSCSLTFRLECDNALKWSYDTKIQIHVTDDPPTPTLTPSTLKVKEGTSVSLTCSAPAPCPSHPPALTWTPSLGDSQEALQENQDKTKVQISILTFTASHLRHGKEISCTAAYNKRSVSSSVTADISYSPKDTTVSVSPSGPVPEDSNVTLNCSSNANPAVRHYTWYSVNGGQEIFKGKGANLKIKASKDSGPFLCKAENDLGVGRSNNCQIDVQYSPKNVTVSVSPSGPVPEDSGVTLTCSSNANPAVRNYIWYSVNGGQEIFKGNGANLKIKASKDSGPFFCKAENDLGVGRSNNCKIDVQYSPKNVTVSVSPSGPVPEDSSVTLTCSSNANPAVRNYIWYSVNGGQEIFKGNGANLKIKASKDSGLFFCKAENDLGVGRSNNCKIDVQYSPKNITVSVSPSGPVPEDSSVTLTCSSNANPAVRNYTWYSADKDQEIFMGTGRSLKIKAPKASFFCKAENDLGAGQSNISQIDVQFAPKILPSSDCAKPTGQINCSCETVGNPSPTLHWYLDGLPVNHSDKFTISNQPVNGTGLRSIIIVNQPQEKDLPTLVCRSTNSLGSASQKFYFHIAEHQGPSMLPVFITTVVALLVLVCALLFVIRVQKTRHNLPNSQCKGDTSTVSMSQLLTSGDGNEVPNTTEEDIYVNTQANTTNSPNLPHSEPNTAEGDGKSSEKEKEEDSDVIYSNVTWKSKKKKKGKDSGDMDQPGSSYLEEERCMVGGVCKNFVSNAVEMGNLYNEVEPKIVRKEVECEYAQVKFKDKNAMHK